MGLEIPEIIKSRIPRDSWYSLKKDIKGPRETGNSRDTWHSLQNHINVPGDPGIFKTYSRDCGDFFHDSVKNPRGP